MYRWWKWTLGLRLGFPCTVVIVVVVMVMDLGVRVYEISVGSGRPGDLLTQQQKIDNVFGNP